MRDDDTGWIEADIVINDRKLTFAESMSVRVAISSFRMFLNNESIKAGLGAISQGYDDALKSVEGILLQTK